MIAHIAPLVRLPRHVGTFDYTIPFEPPPSIGSLVRIDFRGRRHLGVVIGLSTQPRRRDLRLKPIAAVLSFGPIIPSAQLAVVRQVATDSFTALATTLRAVLPTFTLGASMDVPRVRPVNESTHDLPSAIQVQTYLHDHIKLDAIRSLARAALRRKQSFLLVTPTIDRVNRYAAALPEVIPLRRTVTTTAYRTTYLDLLRRQFAAVVGTRVAIFAPLRHLGCIVIDDEDADEHVQDEPSPHYDVRRVALLLARRTGAQVVLTSRFPSLGTYRLEAKPRGLEPRPRPAIVVVDLDHERAARDYRLVPGATLEHLRAWPHFPQTLIVHHRRGAFGALVCADCGFVPTCPTCRVPIPQVGDRLVCRHCANVEAIPNRCPRCRSVAIRGRGRGIEELERELHGSLTEAERRRTTIVTPPELIAAWDARAEATVITNFDGLLAVPRADADERALRLVWTAAARTAPDGLLIVQTESDGRALLDQLDHPSWPTTALAERDRFRHPPAWHTLALRQRAISRRPGPTADLVAERLRTISGLEIIGSHPAVGRSRTDRSGWLILVRYRRSLPARARAMIAGLNDAWTITADPLRRT